MKKVLILVFSFCVLTGCGVRRSEETKSIAFKIPKITTTSLESVATEEAESITTNRSTSKVTKTTSTTKKSSNAKIKKVMATSTSIKKDDETATKFNLTEKDVKNKILELKKIYPTGTIWTNENRRYSFKAINKTNYTGLGCAAFAFMASDRVFGNLPVKESNDFSKIRVGDIIRYMNNTHSVIVLDVLSDSVIVAEANVSLPGYEKGVVYWGRKVSKQDIKDTGTYIYTRWP